MNTIYDLFLASGITTDQDRHWSLARTAQGSVWTPQDQSECHGCKKDSSARLMKQENTDIWLHRPIVLDHHSTRRNTNLMPIIPQAVGTATELVDCDLERSGYSYSLSVSSLLAHLLAVQLEVVEGHMKV